MDRKHNKTIRERRRSRHFFVGNITHIPLKPAYWESFDYKEFF